ncbi:MAG: rod shape-determining protein MreD [bacterium]|nr:rod shape-determining protein MreD [bacterium]
MNRKIRISMMVVMIMLQIIANRYMNLLKINLDLLYLILVYLSVKSPFMTTIISATAIGLATDYMSMQMMGVFGFSRTLAAYALHQTSNHIDLKNNTFVFLFITISLSLSNGLGNIFLYFISDVTLNLNLILYQPILTGLTGILILMSVRSQQYLDVY